MQQRSTASKKHDSAVFGYWLSGRLPTSCAVCIGFSVAFQLLGDLRGFEVQHKGSQCKA